MDITIKRNVFVARKLLQYSVIATACTSLFACANAPMKDGISSVVLDGVHQDGIRAPTAKPSSFKEQTKSKIVAGTMLATAAMMLGGTVQGPTFGTRNQTPAAGYTVTKGRQTVFNGNESTSYVDASLAMAEAMRRKLTDTGIALSNRSHYAISMNEKFWGMDYEKLTDKDNYRVYYNIQASLTDNGKIAQTYSCTGASDDMGSYTYWTDNDKKNIKLHAAAIGDICADRALEAFGLKG